MFRVRGTRFDIECHLFCDLCFRTFYKICYSQNMLDICFSRPIKLTDFPEHWKTMNADAQFKFAEEYEVEDSYIYIHIQTVMLW